MRDACCFDGWPEPMLVTAQRLSMNINKDPPLTAGSREKGRECFESFVSQRNMPGVSAFRLGQKQGLANKINSVPRQGILLTRPHARIQRTMELRQMAGKLDLNHTPKTF